MSEKPDFLQISTETKTARKKLFLFSLTIIFIGYFEPSLTGFLGNFSITIKDNQNHFSWFLLLVLIWLSIRYWMLLSSEMIIQQSEDLLGKVEGFSPQHMVLKRIKSIFYLAPRISLINSEIKEHKATIQRFNENLHDQTEETQATWKDAIEAYSTVEIPKKNKYLRNAYALFFTEVFLPFLLAATAAYVIFIFHIEITNMVTLNSKT